MAGAKSSLMFLKFQYLPAPRSRACSKHMLTDKRTGFAKGFPISGRKSARWSGTMRLFTKGKKNISTLTQNDFHKSTSGVYNVAY